MLCFAVPCTSLVPDTADPARLGGFTRACLSASTQVLRGEWAGYEGEATAVAEETELIIKLAGVTNRSIQILQRADCGRVVRAQA